MSDSVQAEPNYKLLNIAKMGTIATLVLVFAQASTGMAQARGMLDAVSHSSAAMLGLVISIAVAVLIVVAKGDSKLKGLGMGLAMAWFIQYGLGEMFAGGMNWVAWIHAVLAVSMAMHASTMLKNFPKEDSAEA